MKTATVFEIKRFAVHDGDGIRTTVFFKGCPLKCVWCHNPEGISKSPELAFYSHKCKNCGACVESCPENCHTTENGVHAFDRTRCIACGKCEKSCPSGALKIYGKEMTVGELYEILLEDKMFYEQSNGGVTLSGGECLMRAEFCAELLKKLKESGINTAVDTSGFVSKKAIESVFPYTDVFLYDIKSFDSNVHEKATGCPNEVILENLSYLNSLGAKVEIRIPYVPEYNGAEIAKIARFLSTFECITKARILPYHNYASSKYSALEMTNTLPDKIPTDEEIGEAVEIMERYGMKIVK